MQMLPSLQLRGAPPTQVPFWHVSPVVQALPSEQEPPLVGANAHPDVALQESIVHALLSLQTMGAKTHPVAGLQLSEVQALWSSQEIGVCEHPDAGSQESLVQALLSLQPAGGPPMH